MQGAFAPGARPPVAMFADDSMCSTTGALHSPLSPYQVAKPNSRGFAKEPREGSVCKPGALTWVSSSGSQVSPMRPPQSGSAAAGGLGKVRHLAVADLWVQDKVPAGDFQFEKIAGCIKPADILTKHVDAPTMLRHLSSPNMEYEDGRADAAPTLTH